MTAFQYKAARDRIINRFESMLKAEQHPNATFRRIAHETIRADMQAALANLDKQAGY